MSKRRGIKPDMQSKPTQSPIKVFPLATNMFTGKHEHKFTREDTCFCGQPAPERIPASGVFMQSKPASKDAQPIAQSIETMRDDQMTRVALTSDQKDARNTKKEESFKKLASKRVNKVLEGIRLIANLGAANYKSTHEQRSKITNAIRHHLDELEAVFAGEKKDDSKFEL